MIDFWEKSLPVAMTMFFSFGAVLLAINGQNLSVDLYNYNQILSNHTSCTQSNIISANDYCNKVIENIPKDIKDYSINSLIVFVCFVLAVVSGFAYLVIIWRKSRMRT